MGNKKTKKKILLSKKKQPDKNYINRLQQKSGGYLKYFIPFVIITTAIVFANSLGNDFIDNWDDNVYVINNDIIKQLNWKNIKEIFSSFYVGCYQPISMLSYTIEYKLFGLNPFYYHLTNYILHILNAVLVYLFIKRFTGKPSVAAIASLFFAIHPMHVESVAWISERKDVLYTFFFLLSLNSYSKYLLTEKKIIFLIWSFIWFFLSLLSKPSAVCLPVVLVLMDYYHNKKLSFRILISKIPFFILALVFGIIALFAQKSVGAIADLNPLFSIIDRVFLVSYSAVYYIYKVFAPFNLSALNYYPLKSEGFFPVEYYISLPALLLLVLFIYRSGRFKQELIFGLMFYLITIAMTLQIIPAGGAVVAERYSYVPYIGIFFIFGQFFSYIKDNRFSFSGKIKSFVFIVLIIFTALFSFLSYERNKVWKNGIVLFTDVIKKYPDRGYGWYARGNSKDNHGDFEGAIDDYNVTIKLKPYFPEALYNRGRVYSKINKSDKAFTDFNNAIKLDPKYSDVYLNLGIYYSKINKLDSAISITLKGLKYDPLNVFLNDNAGWFYFEKGENDNAIKYLKKCLSADENMFDAILGLAMLYYQKGDLVNSKKYFDQSKNAEPLLNKGMEGVTELEKGRYSYSDKKKKLLKKMFEELK